jgi:NAD(P)H-hydrate epimerase
MKILSAVHARQADEYTIEETPISSIDLMENAAKAFVEWFCKQFNPDQSVLVFAGLGNNGGDGLAIARLLFEQGYTVRVFVARHSAKCSPDFLANADRLPMATEDIFEDAHFPLISSLDIAIDALLGSGLSRPAAGLLASLIRYINQCKPTVVSVDIASGLYSDTHTAGGAIIEPAYTVSFELPKLVFMLPQYQQWVGTWTCVPIGLLDEAIERQYTEYEYMTPATMVYLLPPPRKKFAHKGDFGHALLVAGSEGKMGAAVLAAKAAIRTGLGLLTVHVPQCGVVAMQTAVPEAMCSIDPNRTHYTEAPASSTYQAIGVGPGLGQNADSVNALAMLLAGAYCPVVLDADALNLIAAHPQLMATVPPGSIFTPHPKEFERLAGPVQHDFERLEKLQEYCRTHQINVVLKGAHTAICTPEGMVFFNSTGNPGMSTGGSGDVLTGIIASLLAQGYKPWQAAMFGVYIHGLAGDLAANTLGEISVSASDIINCLPAAFKTLRMHR